LQCQYNLDAPWPDGAVTPDGPIPDSKIGKEGWWPWKKDRGPGKKDQSPGKKDNGAADTGPGKDGGRPNPNAPVVTLDKPAQGSSTTSTRQEFSGAVKAKYPVMRCELYIDGKLSGTDLGPGSKFKFKDRPISAGKRSWYVRCRDIKGKWGTSATRQLDATWVMLSACKTGGWSSRKRYQLSKDLLDVNGSCFVIDDDSVELDGGGRKLVSARRKDLMVFRPSTHPYTVWRNKSSAGGTAAMWQTGWSAPTKGDNAYGQPTAADFDGDSHLDLLLHSKGGAMRIHKNNGTGGFGPTAAWQLSATDFNYGAPRALDWDQDGKLDLVVAHCGDKERLLKGTGVLSMSGFTFAATFDMGSCTRRLTPGDFDGNGMIDLVSGNQHKAGWDGRHHVFLNNKVKFSGAWSSSSTAHVGDTPSFVADFDGDGVWDLLTGADLGSSNRYSLVFQNTKQGAAWNLRYSRPASAPVAAADVDADGDTDLVLVSFKAGSTEPDKLLLAINDGKGLFTSSKSLPIKAGSYPQVLLADLDGSGLPEIVTAPQVSGDALRVYRLGKGATPPKLVWSPLAGNGFHRVLARDLDSDGRLDLALSYTKGLSGSFKRHLAVYRQSQPLKFTQASVASDSTGDAFFMFSPGDIDGGYAAGITVKDKNVRVQNFGAIRGFSIGVRLQKDNFTVDKVTVEDPDLHGFAVLSVKKGTLSNITVKRLHQGVGLRVSSSSSITVNNATLCPAIPDPYMVALAAYCTGTGALAGSGNTLGMINGCGGLKGSTCR